MAENTHSDLTQPPQSHFHQVSRSKQIIFCLAWIAAVAFYFYEIMLLIAPSLITRELTESFQATPAQVGHIGGFYFYAYAGMQIPVGLLMDRFGPRILLTLSALLCAIGCALMSFAPADLISLVYLSRLIMGIGGSFAVVGCLKLASLLFPSHRFALLTGIMMMTGMAGALCTIYFGSDIISAIGWRQSFYWGAIVGLILSGVLWTSLAATMTYFVPLKSLSLQTLKKSLSAILLSPPIWLVSIYAGLMYLPTSVFGELWGIRYLSDRFAISGKEAGTLLLAVFIGWILGGPLFGWLSDFMGERKRPMSWAMILSLAFMLLIMYWPSASPITMMVLLFLLGIASSGFILAFSVVREISPPMLTGTAVGFVNMLNNASGLAQPVIGWLLELQTGEAGHAADYVFTTHQLNNALLLIPLCLLGALFMIPWLPETHCRPMYANAPTPN